jgi:anti-anti-sigma factor
MADRPDGALVANLSGEFDTTNAAGLRAELLGAVHRAGRAGVVVDLVGVRFLDSVGLAALVVAFKTAHRQRLPFRVGQTSEFSARLLQITGLDRLWASDAGLVPTGEVPTERSLIS